LQNCILKSICFTQNRTSGQQSPVTKINNIKEETLNLYQEKIKARDKRVHRPLEI